MCENLIHIKVLLHRQVERTENYWRRFSNDAVHGQHWSPRRKSQPTIFYQQPLVALLGRHLGPDQTSVSQIF